jgi:hypothetical protein
MRNGIYDANDIERVGMLWLATGWRTTIAIES